MGLDEIVEVGFELAEGERVRALVPILGNPPYGTGVDIDGAGRFALAAQGAKMLAVEGVEFFLLSSVHVEFLQ